MGILKLTMYVIYNTYTSILIYMYLSLARWNDINISFSKLEFTKNTLKPLKKVG